MKTLLNKANFIILFLFLSTLAHGAVVVKQVRGNAFMIYNAKTQSLHTGDHIPANAEILTEEGTDLTLANYYQHQFHITGSSHLKVNKKDTILFEGYLWFRSTFPNKISNHDFKIKTANGVIQYNDTEGVVSFDPVKNKTQFLVLRGSNLFYNKVRPGPRYEIKPGMFSLIDSRYVQGVPLKPKPIGLKSYKKLVVLFDNIRPLPNIPGIKDKIQTRSIASIGESNNFQNILNKQLNQQNSKKTGPIPIKINIYAPKSYFLSKPKIAPESNPKSRKKSSSTKRLPASLAFPLDTNPFEQALQSRYEDKMRHEKEINSLINNLKSISKDYQKNP